MAAAFGKVHLVASLGKKIAASNKSYYKEQGAALYDDFSTFAQGKAIALCNASEFADDFAATQGEVTVCEYGVGNGNFARVFLDELQRLSSSLYARTRYHLFDISPKMLGAAKLNLGRHAKICEFAEFHVSLDTPSLEFHYCRINELLSDLSAEFRMRKGMKIVDENGKEHGHADSFISKFLERIDPGRLIPFSFPAQEFISSLVACGKPGFRIDVFDYGFYSADDIFALPCEEWNRVIVRKYGSQLTADLNFIQLSAALAASGVAARVEKQKGYCESVMGKPLRVAHTKAGLDYEEKKAQDGISEDDGFYHLRAGR